MNRTIARRSPLALGVLWGAALVLAAMGCHSGGYASGVYIEPAVYGPYWYPATYGTITYVDVPWWGDPPPPPKIDPRRKDSPTHHAIAEQVNTSFAARGYRTPASDGDVDVTVYASMDPELNIAGYTHIYDFKNLPKLKDDTKFPKGTVIVDVLQPKTHVLLWRGRGVAPVSDNVEVYKKNLRAAVDHIISEYPKAKKS